MRRSSKRIALAAAIVLAVTTGTAQATVCPLKKTCSATGTSTLGPVTLQFSGSGLATTEGLTLNWQRVNMSGVDDLLGSLTASLRPGVQSSGTLSSASFPAMNHNDFLFGITAANLGATLLVSNSPVQLEATINAIPPTATYTMVGGPVNFYAQGDLSQTTVLTLSSASVQVSPDNTIIPTLSEWGMLTLVIFLLGTGLFVVVRRNKLATQT